MRVSDMNYVFTHLAGNWQDLARCRDTGIEMLPGPETEDVDSGPEVIDAKKTCASCPVKQECLTEVTEMGGQFGVWGGLTSAERDRLRLSNLPSSKPGEYRTIVKCEVCGFDCVPAIKAKQKCDTCLSPNERPGAISAFKDQVIAMIDDRKSYREIAHALGFTQQQVGKACRNWKTPSKAGGRQPGSRHSDVAKLAPCGTPAGRRRHQRRGESITTCACSQPGSSSRDRTRKNGWVA